MIHEKEHHLPNEKLGKYGRNVAEDIVSKERNEGKEDSGLKIR